ncbi:membrane protein [Amylibacter marinus]|uniref:Membrane protein n=1 Tax=Amylibacter marinus TaxID=1475483 RepID=A0ABQ5VR39_9RHOB|nr:OmpA family protein [Amylibacter marinus]GLQ33795.1 membrane protein [Amylibacter marinus]
MKHTHLIASSALVFTLAACSADNDYRSDGFSSEAGTQITGQGFGVASAHNAAALNGDLRLEMIKNLTRLFASEAPATVNFAFNSSKLDAAAKDSLRKQAQWIKDHPQITFRVFGHTDKVGSDSYNKRLGARRARAAVNYLISQGVSRKKVEAVVSFGETRPLVLTESRNRENRRTVTEVRGFYSGKKGDGIDGKYAVNIYKTYVGAAQEASLPETTINVSQ